MLFDSLGIFKPKNKIFFSLAIAIVAVLSVTSIFVNPIFAAILPIVSVLFYLLYKNPMIGLYVMVFLFPYQGVSFKVLNNFNFQFIDAFTLFFAIVVAIKFLFNFLFDKANFEKIKFPLLKTFGLFFVSGLVSIINSLDTSFSFVYLIRFIAFAYIGFIVLPVNILKDKKQLHNLIFTLLLTSVITVGVQFLYVYKSGFNVDFRGQVSSMTFKGIYPFGENHNLLGEVYAIAVFAALYLVHVTKNMTWRFVYMMSFILLIIADFVMLSRSSFVAVLASVGLLFVIYPFIRENQSLKKAVFEISFRLFSIFVFCVIALGFYTNFINQISTKEVESSSVARIDMTKSSFRTFLANPIIGNGVANFKMLLGNDQEYLKNYYLVLDSHGIVQKILVEQGLVGVITFSMFVFAIFIMFYKAIKSINNYDDRMALAIIFSLAFAALVIQLFNTTYYTYKLWLPLGLFVITARIYTTKKLS